MTITNNPYALHLSMSIIESEQVLIEVALSGLWTPDGPVYDAVTIHIRHTETGATLSYAEIPVSAADDVAQAALNAFSHAAASGELLV